LRLFEPSLSTLPSSLPALPDPQGSAPLSTRARAYLHANCASCHRPQGTGQGPANFLFTASTANMGICNVTPTEGNLGVPGAVLLAPGAPERSLVWLRMRDLANGRMPPLASHVVDAAGSKLIEDWIRGMGGCQ